MPPHSKEVQLTEMEVELMAVFVRRLILNDHDCAVALTQLADKLEGQYAQDAQ